VSTVPVVAVVMVTHNSQRYLSETLASIASQSRAADVTIAIDDASTDGTVNELDDHGFTIQGATSTAIDLTTRIAQNFHQGLRAATMAGADLVILGDHDDVWHVNRIEHQTALLEQSPSTAMIASDGYLIDEHGAAAPGTIRTTFPVPEDFSGMPLRAQIAFAMRHSIATGGTCALRPTSMTDWSIPAGWLHDRWWSLRAVRSKCFELDTTPVIDYRISADQQVGLYSADQEDNVRWIVRKATEVGATVSKASDLRRLLKS